MGTFEDNIRRKFNSEEVPFGAESWDAFEHKLDGAQMSDLLFTQKVVNALEFSLVPYSPSHWKTMHQKLDLDVEGNFESKIRSKFSGAVVNGPVIGWEDMPSNLNVTEDFEQSVKEGLNAEEVEYEEEHWKAMEKILDRDKKPVFWMYAGIGALVFGAVSVWGLLGVDSLDVSQKIVNNEIDNVVVDRNVSAHVKTLDESSIQFNGDEKKPVLTSVNDDTEVFEPSTDIEKKYLSKYKHTTGITEREFLEKQNRLAEANKSKYLPSQKTKKGGRVIGGSVRGGNGVNDTQSDAATSNNQHNSVGSSEEQSFKMAEMIEEGVAFTEPYLDYQYTEVRYEKVSVKKQVLNAGLLPWLNFWDNAAATGLNAKNQVSLFSSQDWKSYNRYGKQVGFEFNQPFQLLGGYEHQFQKSGFAVGSFLSTKWQNNWVCSTTNLSGSYETQLNTSVLRIGLGVSYKRNKLLTEGLTLRDQISETTSSFNESSLDEYKVPVETYLVTNMGVVLANEHFMFSYNMSDPFIVRINYDNEIRATHTGIASGTVSLSNSVKLSGMAKVTLEEAAYFTPAIALTKEDSWFLLTEYEELNRYVFTVGYQFANFRTYGSYGHVTRREVESSITDLFSQSGHLAVGVIYTRN